MYDESNDDFHKLIFVSFSEDKKLRVSDLVRLWSLELQWMKPEEASLVIEKLIQSGWFKLENNFVSPAIFDKKSIPSLGWQPMLRIISSPPIFNSESTSFVDEEEVKSEIVVNVVESEKNISEEKYPPDRSESNIPALIRFIAKKSKIDNREVVRRAQRKRRSLGPITLWMSLALVAREQGLDMVEVSSLIEPV
ncbi:MAG: hypothetical protein CMA98_01265 [Euryarchaeota archaeon]|jgi:hypothetical protein|nr:hypothetical protein [Euryarchaeota archaeon]|tara:strand:- start:1374 stop:1955 length:582 start_codon:yes stop_codon:yes gene_type:complete